MPAQFVFPGVLSFYQFAIAIIAAYLQSYAMRERYADVLMTRPCPQGGPAAAAGEN